MKLMATSFALACGLCGLIGPQAGGQHLGGHIMLAPSELTWTDLPSVPGVKIAVIEGPLNQAVPIMFRLKFPANFDIPPHWHPGIEHITIRFGFSDDQDLPRALRAACLAEVLHLDPAEIKTASYFISRGGIRITKRGKGMAGWRKKLFVGIAHNAADPAARFTLPPQRTVTMGSDVEI